MEATPRTRLVPAERRELIVRAALRHFGHHGYAATRLDDIAAAAGVTKPVVYRHFDSKKDLYIVLLRRHEVALPTFIERASADVGTGATPEQLLRASLAGWLDYVEENSDSWLVIFRDKTGDPDIERARVHLNERAQEVLAGFIASAAPDLDPDLVDPRAAFLSIGLAGLVLWWIDNPDVSRERVEKVAVRAAAATLRE